MATKRTGNVDTEAGISSRYCSTKLDEGGVHLRPVDKPHRLEALKPSSVLT